MNYVYFSATLDAAVWGAELAGGEGRGRIYIVEPTGEFEDDPNLTDKKYPGNPTHSFRSREPLRVIGELDDWVGHPPERLEAMRAAIDEMQRNGSAQIEDSAHFGARGSPIAWPMGFAPLGLGLATSD